MHKGLFRGLGLSALLFAAPLLADPITISALPSENEIAEGDSIGIDIVVSDIPDFDAVSAYDLTMAFDSSILGFTGAVFGDALGDASAFEVFEDALYPYGGDPDQVNIAALSLLFFELFDLQPSGSDVLLATLLFEGIGVGTSSLTFVPDTVLGEPGIIIKDFFGSAFLGGDVPTNGAQITVGEAATEVPEPGTLALLMLGIALLLGGRATRMH